VAADAAEPVAEVEAEVAVGVAVVAVLATEATLAMEEEAAARRLSGMISKIAPLKYRPSHSGQLEARVVGTCFGVRRTAQQQCSTG
jgi:hypothetical protein